MSNYYCEGCDRPRNRKEHGYEASEMCTECDYDTPAPKASLEAQQAASHNLWSAKATSRLISYINLTTALGRLFREDVISAEAMSQLFLVMDQNERDEKEATFEAEMIYKEVTK